MSTSAEDVISITIISMIAPFLTPQTQTILEETMAVVELLVTDQPLPSRHFGHLLTVWYFSLALTPHANYFARLWRADDRLLTLIQVGSLSG